MRRLLKKSLLNGLIRTFLTILFAVFSRLKPYGAARKDLKENVKVKKPIKYYNTSVINDEKEEKTEVNEESETLEESSSEESDDIEEELDENEEEQETDEDEEKTSEIDEPNEIVVEPIAYNKKGSDELKPESSKNKIFRLKTVFLFVLLIISYVCLNNYLIMFIYYKSAKVSTTVVKSTSSSFIWFSWLNFNRNRPDFDLDNNSDDKLKTLIDPLDIEFIANKAHFYDNRQRVVLSDSYFDEDNEIERFKNRTVDDFQYSNELKRKTNHRECMLPKLNPYDREIMQFVKREEDIRCNPKKNWIYIENGTLRVSKGAIKKHGPIVCAYIPLYRGNNDFSVYEGNRIFPVMDRMPLITDFFKIDCRSKDGAIYSNIHSGIAYESSLHMRHMWNPLPKKALGYNVLMFGFDSVSRMSWIRMLPKSYEYMLKLGFVVLKGYNIVGDGTPQALLPILTGKKETELPEARRGFANANYVDSFPWVWRDYKNAGYVTQWAEDMQSIGTFQLRMLGFRKQPVDHYMRVFYLEAERYYSRFRRLCLGSISRHRNMFNWVKEFFLIYDGKPKFSFIFHSEASHNYNNPLSLLDDDLRDFLVYLKQSGIMDNTILLFMSDHGMRISDLRQYSQGKLEERLPFFSILMPKSFQENHPNEMRNLRMNARKLTTPFDIHETLKHFLHFDKSSGESNSDSDSESHKNDDEEKIAPRGISLLKKIPVNRNCEDAQIEAHWCSCLNWIDINITQSTRNNVHESPQLDQIDNQKTNNISIETSDELNQNRNQTNFTEPLFLVKQKVDFSQLTRIDVNLGYISESVIKIANRAVGFINSLIDKELRLYCYKLRLYSIQKLSKLDLNRKLLAFKKSKDIHGREALFDDLNANDNNVSNPLDEFSMKRSALNYLLPSSNKTSNMTDKFSSSLSRDSIYQIIFTTWPGNATFELSFRFNRFTGELKFNRNEVSRINSYNSTSNCMVNKRPDLRQYCYCRYI